MKPKRLPMILLAICLAFLLGSVSNVYAGTLSNADLQAGQVKAEKTVIGPDSDGNYTISLSVTGKNKEVTTPSNADVVLVLDNSGSMKEYTEECGSTSFKKHGIGFLSYYTCTKCGAKYDNKPAKCTELTGGKRIDIAKEVGKTFAKDILTSDSDNRMAVIGFAGESNNGGAGETGAITASQSLTKKLNSVTGTIDKMNASGGTNYSAALNQAYSYLKNRTGNDAKRPGFVIFISDGAPGLYGESQNDPRWNGQVQANSIKGLPAKLYTIGISLDQSASNYMASLASDTGHYKNVTGSDFESQLADIMKEWADQINSIPAGSNATMNDIVNTDKFEVVGTSSGLVAQQADGSYSWNIGDVVEKTQTQTIKIKPIDSGVDMPTNDDVTLKYTDADGKKVSKGKAEIGDPSVSVAKVTFKVEHGSWKDKSSEKSVLVPLDTETGLGTLSASDVPTGMVAEEGYTNGHWVVTPNTAKDGISGDVTYTYAFDAINYAKVTFKVKDGTWADGTTADKTEKVALSAAGTGTLDESKVPTGMIANDGFYEDGHWDVTPNTNKDGIKEDVTYTYSFDSIEHATVTFKVKNGTWADGTTEAKTESVALSRDGKGTLSEEAVPTGMIAGDGFENGHWVETPDTAKDAVTGNVTYTYLFDKYATVTFNVEHGTWSDDSTEAITEKVKITDGAGTLEESKVPTGMKAADGYYEDGHWATKPDTAKDAITKDVAYTYTFDSIEHATVTFKVKNGTWADGTTEAKTESVALSRDGKGSLSEEAVPTGMIAGDGFENGHWVETPDTAKDAVTGNVTYTYLFDKYATVKFKIVNGTWSDGSTEAITEKVKITDGAGTLDESKVPTGMIAGDEYENGHWDVMPNTAKDGITEDVTYTYEFSRIQYATVTFKVEHGTWADDTTADKTVKVRLKNGKGTLDAVAVPTGMKAADGYYEDGHWDVVPNVMTDAITGNVSYTYSFDPVQYKTVTFKVEHGTWSDNTTKDKTTKVAMSRDGKGTLEESKVPTGMKAAEGYYDDGHWATKPDTAKDAITKDVTYTYTFDPIEYATVTFKVKNGTWADGTAEAKTTSVALSRDGKGTLNESDVPTGMIAGDGFENGHWVETPDTAKDAVSKDGATYTYLFDKYATVTFNVEHGTWSDDSTEAITEKVKITDGAGTLEESNVPTGMKAADGYYEDGHWVTKPDTAKDAVTEDVAYTYTFDAVEHADVTFKVENGTWSDGTTDAIVEKVALSRDGKGTLSEEAVPTGMKALDGFENGEWKEKPNTEKDAITKDVTYTYSFDKKPPVITKATATFKVENGTWADGTTADKTQEVTLADGIGTLDADAVPTGMIAEEGYEGGAWDVTPNTAENGFTGDATYTYTFTKKPPVITQATVTFKVVNGTWEDKTTEDKYATVTLTDGYGTLSSSSVPTGMIADEGYEGGAWDVTPNTTENGIGGNITYTYSFSERQPVITQATVTFKVVNGTWSDGTTADKTETITLYDGVGTLPEALVPTGMLPDEKYEGGAWDVTPNTAENAVTQDVAYTYSFTEEEIIVPDDDPTPEDKPDDDDIDPGDKDPGDKNPPAKDEDPVTEPKDNSNKTTSETKTVATKHVTKTDDTRENGLWILLMILSAFGVSGLAYYQRKKVH